MDERLLSTFEMASSGVVAALLSLLCSSNVCDPKSAVSRLIKESFADNGALTLLVRKLVSVLESVERFPQYLYDTPGGSAFGLQLLNRRLRYVV